VDLQCSDKYGGARPFNTGELSLQLEENPVGDVEPVQLVVQYLTKAVIKLPSAGDNTRSSVQHPL